MSKTETTNIFKQTFENTARHFGLMQSDGNGGVAAVDAAEITPKKIRAFCGKDLETVREMAIKGRTGAGVRGTDPTPLEIVEAATAARWGYTALSFRGCKSGRRNASNKRFSFHDDMQKFGAAKFKKDGATDPNSIGKGPTYREYLQATQQGKS